MHNYPKTRKSRDVSYSKSYKLLIAIGEDELKELFQRHGMYVAAKILSKKLNQKISPFVVRYCRKRYNIGSR